MLEYDAGVRDILLRDTWRTTACHWYDIDRARFYIVVSVRVNQKAGE